MATEPARTTTTDPYAVPSVIDAAYVNRVLAGLDAITGDVVRLVVSTKTIPREAYDRLRALYAEDSGVQREINLYERDMFQGLTGYKSDPGNKKTDVTDVITAGRTCIFARVQRDFSAVGTNAAGLITQWIAIRPIDQARDPNGYNRTGWAYGYEGTTEQRAQPANPCQRT